MAYDPKAWTWWSDALAGKHPTIFNDTPMTGYYGFRPGGKVDAPQAVAFWYSAAGELKCKIGASMVRYGLDIWANCARNPISQAVYDTVINGGLWPSEIRIDTERGSDSTLVQTPRAAGGNAGDDVSTLRGNIQEWTDRAKKVIAAGVPKTQAEADALADLKTKLGEMLRDADGKRKAVTDPMYETWQKASAEFMVWIKPAQTILNNLSSLADTYLKQENARRRQLAAEANEKAKADAAAQASQGAEAEPPKLVEPVRATMGTRRTVTTVRRDTVVFDDFVAAAAFICSQKGVDEEIVTAIRRSTYHALKAGLSVPGARLDKEESAR